MRVYEAAEEVLKEEKRALDVKEIYEKIIEKGLYEFHAKSPTSVVSKALRQRTRVMVANEKDAVFEKMSDGKYRLIKEHT